LTKCPPMNPPAPHTNALRITPSRLTETKFSLPAPPVDPQPQPFLDAHFGGSEL
jgi:hypothetical protein